ncbi:unnamed protein product [Acanthocheilonema viteae]|uniref:ZP domain-containing protein n=1 Tax=Acanthocheilonema viteae TaxID=6277 RepID=A0A498SAT2_ACAVI|nr:unnamed protein product [Acanthocheilonema viteae]
MTSPSNGNPKHVYIYMYGFQFTSSQFVYFECQAKPCIRSCKRQQCEVNKTMIIEKITTTTTTTTMAVPTTTITTAIAKTIKTTKSVIRFRRETEVKVVKLLTVLEMRPPLQIYADKFHSNPNTTDSRFICPSSFFHIMLFIMLGLMPTVTLIVCYGIILYRRQQTLHVQRTSSFSGIHTESAFSSASDN